MKNFLLVLASVFLIGGSYGQSLDLWEKAGSKKQLHKRNHSKIKSLKRAKLKLDTLSIDAEELVLPDFVVKEGDREVKVKKPKHFKIKHGENEGILTVTENGVLGTIEGLNITDEGLVTPVNAKPVLETDDLS